MTIEAALKFPHWSYFLAIEEDLLRLSRFVDFSGNENTYSLEIARLLMAAAAEVDVVLKQLCKQWNQGTRVRTIEGYQGVIAADVPGFKRFTALIPRFGLTLQPWSTWAKDQPPQWWTAYNKTKHHRHTHFKRATLKNCINSVAGLFIAVLFLYAEEASGPGLTPPAQLLAGGHKHRRGNQQRDHLILPVYEVPVPRQERIQEPPDNRPDPGVGPPGSLQPG